MRARISGFTLVELAIVLVIIGLLVGGVLVGQSLIKEAEIRSVGSQLNQYNAGAATFHLKYRGIPGDILSGTAATFGLVTRAGTYGRGNGDGMIQSGPCCAYNRMGYEPLLFWRDLGDVQLVPGSYSGTDAIVPNLASSEEFVPYVPELNIRTHAFVHIVPFNGRNYYLLRKMDTTTAGSTIGGSDIFSSYEASGIDEKLDDGMPFTGTVITANGIALDTGSGVGSGACGINTTTPEVYNTANSTWANNINCQLLVRAGF